MFSKRSHIRIAFVLNIYASAACLCVVLCTIMPWAYSNDEQLAMSDVSPEDLAFFEKEVRPLLVKRCFECHGGSEAEGGLSLASAEGWKRGGDSGPAIVPGKADESVLVQAIHYDSWEMPPADRGGKLPDEEIAILTKWVEMGAPDPRTGSEVLGGMTLDEAKNWWAFQPLPEIPPAKRTTDFQSVESVDGQDVRPTNQRTTDFQSVEHQNQSATDWKSVVHQEDVQRIDDLLLKEIESRGLELALPADRRTLLRRLTYDLTGLPPTHEEVQAFVADQSPDAYSKVVERLLDSPQYGVQWGRRWLDVVRYADSSGTTSDHPLPHAWRYRNWVMEAFQKDLPYDTFVRWQLAGDLLTNESEPEERAEGVIATGYLAIARRFGFDSDKDMFLTYEDAIDNVGKSFLGLTISCARCHDHKFDPIVAEDYYALYGIFESSRFSFPGCEKDGKPRDLVPLVSQSERSVGRTSSPSDNANDRLGSPSYLGNPSNGQSMVPVAFAVVDADAKNARLHKRGEPDKLGDEVPRRWLSVFGGEKVPENSGSGRRELGDWIAQHPLTSRVMVNRIWQWHFGLGLVRTANDFGTRGDLPTHPELLDFLAARFVQSGYSVKAMHRLIVKTEAYQRASATPVAEDASNQYLAHFNRRRLTAEELRDSLLLASGQLDLAPGTAHPFPEEKDWKFSQHRPFNAVYETNKRSAFMMVQRQRRHPFLALFDGADPNASTATRQTTTVPTQALYFINDPFFHEQATSLASSLLEESSDEARVTQAYRRLFQRESHEKEIARCQNFLASYPGDAQEKWSGLSRILRSRA